MASATRCSASKGNQRYVMIRYPFAQRRAPRLLRVERYRQNRSTTAILVTQVSGSRTYGKQRLRPPAPAANPAGRQMLSTAAGSARDSAARFMRNLISYASALVPFTRRTRRTVQSTVAGSQRQRVAGTARCSATTFFRQRGRLPALRLHVRQRGDTGPAKHRR